VAARRSLSLEVGDRHTIDCQFDHLVLAEFDRLPGVADKGRNIGPEEVLAFPAPHDQGRVAPSTNDDSRLIGMHGDQCESAIKTTADAAHGLGQAHLGVELLSEQVRDDLGVGVGPELVSVVLELVA
jgi:hypothetical protein